MSTPSGYGKSLSNQCAASSRSAAFEEFHLIHSFCIIVCDEIAQSTAQTSLKFLSRNGKEFANFFASSQKNPLIVWLIAIHLWGPDSHTMQLISTSCRWFNSIIPSVYENYSDDTGCV